MWRRCICRLGSLGTVATCPLRSLSCSPRLLKLDNGESAEPVPRSLWSRQQGRRSRIIHDVHEEEAMLRDGIEPDVEEVLRDPLDAWGRERGVSGVFDVEELVAVLRGEGAEDVAVIRIPPEHAYVGHMVFATIHSKQHMLKTAQFVKRLYKRKRRRSDPVPRIEGRESDKWVALDLVNIAVHLMDFETRASYDVDGLWAVGPQFDEQSQPEENLELLANDPLADFRPWGADKTDLQPDKV